MVNKSSVFSFSDFNCFVPYPSLGLLWSISVRLQICIMFFHQYYSILLLSCIQIVHHNIFVVSFVISVDTLPWSLLKQSWNAILLAFPRSSRHWLAYILVPSSTLCVFCELDPLKNPLADRWSLALFAIVLTIMFSCGTSSRLPRASLSLYFAVFLKPSISTYSPLSLALLFYIIPATWPLLLPFLFCHSSHVLTQDVSPILGGYHWTKQPLVNSPYLVQGVNTAQGVTPLASLSCIVPRGKVVNPAPNSEDRGITLHPMFTLRAVGNGWS